MESSYSKLSVLFMLQRRSITLQPIKHSLALVAGFTTSKENTTFSARREPAAVPASSVLRSAYTDAQRSVSTLRSAIELKSVFDQIQAAEKAGNLSPDERKKLEITSLYR